MGFCVFKPALCSWLFLAIALLAGCGTFRPEKPGSVPANNAGKPSPGASAPSQSLALEYDVTPEAAWDIAKIIFRWEGTDAIEEYRSQGYMLTSKSVNTVPNGLVMGAWIEKGSRAQTTKLTILTQQRVLTKNQKLNQVVLHKRFAQALSLVKQGKVLPRSAPPLPA